MNNCLVTKLKDVVNNDNIEKLGEVKFVMNNGNGSNESDWIVIGNGGSTPITYDTNGTLESSVSNNWVNKVVPANSIIYGFVRKTAVPADTTYFTINPKYNIERLQINHLNNIIGGKWVFKNIRALYLHTNSDIYLSGIEENTNLVYLNSNIINNDFAEIILSNNISNLKIFDIPHYYIGDDKITMMQKIQQLSYNGDIANLPKSVILVNSNQSYPIHGTIESFVACMRSNGRIKGCVLLNFWSAAFKDLTYGGISLSQHMINIGLNNRKPVYLSGTADNISFVQDTAPVSYIAPDTITSVTLE